MSSGLVNSSADALYYEHARGDLLARLPRPLGAVVDVGCAAGGNGPVLRDLGATHLEGVELVESQAERARAHFDVVHAVSIERALPQLTREFDTLLLLDVLEHLADPYSVLRGLRAAATSTAHLQISVPNARYRGLLWDLAVRGTFGYTEMGHRDWTHLRWFTRSDLEEALLEAGWRAVWTGYPPVGPRGRLLARLGGRTARELLASQLYVIARAI